MLNLVLVWVVAMDAATAEKLARQQWFDFELTGVTDWVSFYAKKKAEEDAFAAAWAKESHEQKGFHEITPQTASDARALRLLQREFDDVAKARETALLAEAKRVLLALKAGNIDAVIPGCVMYQEGPDREKYTRQHFKEQREVLKRAAAAWDEKTPLTVAYYSNPEPEAGMTGQATIEFGVKAPKPKGKDGEWYPERHTIELWWSGVVMPNANGPRFASPQPGKPKEGRWDFYQVLTPWSVRRTYRI